MYNNVVHGSAPPSLPFDELVHFTIDCGGDVDSIVAMSVSLWGTANGASRLPDVEVEGLPMLPNLARRIHDIVNHG